jgi:hypothetical protein
MHYFIVACLAGLACKLYDDLSDNPLLEQFKSPSLMEFLKGMHYVLFTILALHNPVFLMLIWSFCTVNLLKDPTAWSGSYESSFYYIMCFMCILLVLKYDQLPSLNMFDVVCIFAMLSLISSESRIYSGAEFSIAKLITRGMFVCITLCMTILPFNSVTFKYMFLYGIGYLLCSVAVQYYSLLTSYRNPKPIKKKRSKRGS